MRVSLLKITLVVLLGSSWIFASFVLSTRPEQATSGALMNLARLPASIPTNVFSPAPHVYEKVRMDVVKVACWDGAQEGVDAREVQARWIRLTGKGCDKGNAKVLSVRNLSNGYAATIFDGKENALTTDFIPLEDGPNKIQIRFEQTPGVTLENQFTFLRR